MGDVGLLVSHRRRSDEAFQLWGLSRKVLRERIVSGAPGSTGAQRTSPTNVALVTIRFQPFLLVFPVLTTLNISSSAIPRTLGNGTLNLPAFSFRFCFTAELSALASFWPSRSSRYVGSAPSGMISASLALTLRSSCALIVFFIKTFSA